MTNFPVELIGGYLQFKRGTLTQERQRYEALAAQGQKPSTLVVACCDSRAAPETIFNAAPGEIFVVRNVANLVPSYEPDGGHHSTSAALEFAVQSLKVQHIVVLGHGRCGGIQAALNPSDEPMSPGDFIGKWMGLLAPTAEAVAAMDHLSAAERQLALERLSVANSIANLRTFPCISILEKRGKLHLHGAWFDISRGELWILNPQTGEFNLLDDGSGGDAPPA